MMIAGTLLVILLMVTVFLPVPYAVERPGPTVDILQSDSEEEGSALISIEGAEIYPTDGQLRLTTVSTQGGPGYPVRAGDVLLGWWQQDAQVTPVETQFDETATEEELAELSQRLMVSSQRDAATAALESLDYDLDMVLNVAGITETSDALGKVEPDDVIVAITGPDGVRHERPTYAELLNVTAGIAPGQEVTLDLDRDGEEVQATFATGEPQPLYDGGPTPDGSVLGIFLIPDIELPVDISFDIQRIGGPSAGMMFALSIIDLLTEGEMTGGEVIAGTGTMDAAGRVGPIGGIVFKMWGSLRDGAQYFLAPHANCGEVVGNVPDGLSVFAVDTLDSARAAVEAIANGDTSGLTTCEAVTQGETPAQD